jgi:hypothetical protein
MKVEKSIDRLLQERLEQFKVPVEVRNNLRIEIMAIVSRPDSGPQGTYVYRPEQSMQGDLERKNKVNPKT